MKKKIAANVLRLIGWKMEGTLPPGLSKCVVMMAPHTSMWDFVLGWLGYMALGLNSRYLIKKEMFFFPLGYLLKAMGAIPVDRVNSSPIVMQVSQLIKKSPSIILTITPEGTRSLRQNWKKGFYHIAMQSEIPIVMGFLDYKFKKGGLGPVLTPTGNYESDFQIIENFYKNINARHPEKFSLSPQNRKSR